MFASAGSVGKWIVGSGFIGKNNKIDKEPPFTPGGDMIGRKRIKE